MPLLKKSRIEATQKDDGSGIPAFPAGEAEVTRQLRLEFIPYSVQDLIDVATKEFAWCDAELLKASREMGFGDNWKAAQEKVKNAYVEPGKQPDAMNDLYKQSVDFLKHRPCYHRSPVRRRLEYGRDVSRTSAYQSVLSWWSKPHYFLSYQYHEL